MKLPFDRQNPPATDEDIETLKSVSPHELPPVYLALLKYTNGGEWPISMAPFTFVMFETNVVVGNLTGTDFGEVYPHCVPIGGDGMSEYIALDFSEPGPPRVVAIDATEEDQSSALYPVTNTLEEFIREIGKEPEVD